MGRTATELSDYGSGSSESFLPRINQNAWSSFQPDIPDSELALRRRSLGFLEDIKGSRSIDAVMQEFRLNGSDSPYDPESDYLKRTALSGMGPSSNYLRQKSWPAPDSTPSTALPIPERQSRSAELVLQDRSEEVARISDSLQRQVSLLSEQQQRVLASIPGALLLDLLRELELVRARESRQKHKEMECRFCKNNGERVSYYRSHSLRAAGCVTCPVLRALVCRQCGAHGDRAHTIKYCPLTSPADRRKSAALMQSVRLASSGGRVGAHAGLHDDYVVYGQLSPALLGDGPGAGTGAGAAAVPLEPQWAALERKLMV